MAKKLFRAFIDETGDRGWGGRSSAIFVVSAVMVPDGQEGSLIEALDKINATLGKPAGPCCTGRRMSRPTRSASTL
jgi:hypothetical protein